MAKREAWNKFVEQIKDESFERKGRYIPKEMVTEQYKNAGVFFGKKKFKKTLDNVYIGKSIGSDGNVLVVGGAGSGKSSCIAMPTLETWGGGIFAIDIKGELTEYWKKISTHDRFAKRPIKIINLTNEDRVINSYDPFYFLKQDGDDNLVQNAREIAQAIVPLSQNVPEPFWIQSAQNILTAALLHGYRIGSSFNETITRVVTIPIWELAKEIYAGKDVVAKMLVVQFASLDKPADNRMLTGISAELNSKISVLATDIRIKGTFAPSKNSVKWEDLETHNVFLRISEDMLGQWGGAIAMMLTQLIRSLERRRDKIHTTDGTSIILSAKGEQISQTLLLLDEFPRLGKVDVIENAVSTLRSKGVTICLLMQSITQLDRIYGSDARKIIIDNCQYKVILRVTDPENQKFFSDMIGSISVSGTSVSQSIGASESKEKGEKKTKGESRSVSLSYSETREPIIYPHELATLEDVLLVTPEGFCRVDKMPYYADKSEN